MPEEKRIITHNGRCLYITKDWRDKKVLDGDYDSRGIYTGAKPTPMTKQEFIKLATNEEKLERYASIILHWYGAPDKEAMEKFWDMFSKPVPDKKWYVKVPQAHHTYYHKWLDCDVLGADSVQGVYDQLNPLNDTYEFTEEEIKYYGLQDCKREAVDE